MPKEEKYRMVSFLEGGQLGAMGLGGNGGISGKGREVRDIGRCQRNSSY